VDIDREDYEYDREDWLDERADAMIDYAQDDELNDRLMTDPEFYDRTIGWF
jgi:hypothetical protein